MLQLKQHQSMMLGDILDIRDGTHDTPQYVERGIPLITSKNLTDSGLCFKDINFISEDNHREISKRSAVERGDILYGMIGTIGKPTLVNTDRSFSIKNVALFKQSNPSISNRYLLWLLNSPSINKQIAQASRGGTQKFVSLGALRGLKATFPPLPEQIRIAAILDQADALRVKRREALAQLDSLTQAIFIEMFGDPATNPKKWTTTALGEVIDELTDYHANGSYEILRNHVELLDTPNFALMLRTTDLENNNYVDGVKFITEHAYNFLKKSKVFGGEIIINKIGSAGKVYLAPDFNRPVSLGMNSFLLRVIKKANAQFIYRMLTTKYIEGVIHSKVRGAVTKTITKEAVRSIEIPLPPIDLQLEFAGRIAALEKLRESHLTSLSEFDRLFASLQHRAFRGEL